MARGVRPTGCEARTAEAVRLAMTREQGGSNYLGGSRASVATLSPSERLDEVAEILAGGLQRLLTRKSSRISDHLGESSLDCPGQQSGHADVLMDGGRE